jgi:acetyl-CoA synthetase/medium-chain acyl-CoA synthetase
MNSVVVPEFFNFATNIFDGWARSRPQATALWCVDGATAAEQKFTFSELSRMSAQAANAFRTNGIRRGDHVLVMLPRVWQWWVVMLGLTRLGAVPIPATLQLMPRDVAYRLKAARIHAVVTNTEGIAKIGDFDGPRLVIGEVPSGWVDFNLALKRASAEFSAKPTRSDDPGILYFTSATAGEPKMVLHTQASYGLAHRATGELWLDCKPTDLHWNVSDLGWGKAAWSSFFGPWHMGACVFSVDGKFDPARVLDVLERFPISTWCVPPTALRMIVRQNVSKRNFPHLRHCVTAGEPLNPETMKHWKSATGLDLYEGYGQTESVILIGNFRSHNIAVRPGSMGQPTPGFELALLDEELSVVPDGREGEIAVRVDPKRPVGLFREYWLNPEGTATQFQDGWYLTRDRAVRDTDGYFWFVGRADDVIKSSGYRIGPFEVESVLLEHPAVLEAAVVGKPDPVRGQIVKAFIILRPEYAPSDDLKHELQQHFKQSTAPYKYPREIEFVSELPKTTSGKTRHFELRRQEAMA